MGHSEFPFKELAPEASKYLYLLIIYSHKAAKDSDLGRDSDLEKVPIWRFIAMITLESHLPSPTPPGCFSSGKSLTILLTPSEILNYNTLQIFFIGRFSEPY